MADVLNVDVVFVNSGGALRRSLHVAAGTTVAQAVRLSGIDSELADDVGVVAFGVFGRRVDGATAVADGDRIELYRPLALDPMTARRRRAGG